ncbi:hypothetical protein SAMN02910413_1950 [Pseudobutyrivibrio sp. C4]|uniref:hypothetical protein n=1 Tax=Pseudobutyrivibrio sp. C4 TaxID=1520803 RepID=UPI0008BE6160|nr:hypothetical protein [Pseudobutyrivibrio sp. C4]SET14544.1 hypothetical protein SAMN02910413_1950 [Pseudobutyrivibrio sp. C4]
MKNEMNITRVFSKISGYWIGLVIVVVSLTLIHDSVKTFDSNWVFSSYERNLFLSMWFGLTGFVTCFVTVPCGVLGTVKLARSKIKHVMNYVVVLIAPVISIGMILASLVFESMLPNV